MNAFKWATTAAAAGALALVASADTETPWFNVNFDADTTWTSGTRMTVTDAGVTQGYFDKATGVEDESSQLIDYQSDSAKEAYDLAAADGKVLELNTQGSELTFSPAIQNPANNGDLTVIEADVFFIASESAPSGIAEDNTVQVALYLKAEDGEDPVFQVLTTDADTGLNAWVDLNYDLTGVDVSSGIWRKIQITVDKDAGTATYCIGPRGGTVAEVDTKGLAANNLRPQISTVAFKGTGLVDNFVGKAITPTAALSLTYAGSVNGSSQTITSVTTNANEATFTIDIEGYDSNNALVTPSKIVTYTYGGSVGKTYTVAVAGNTEDGYTVTLTDENSQVTTPLDNADFAFQLAVDVSSFVDGYSEAPADPIVAIEVWYGEEETPSDFPTQEEFATAMATALADSATASAGIDSTDGGFKVSFSAPYAGTYQLVSATTVDAATFATVEDEEVVEADATVTLTDDDTTASAKFYKIKLVDPSASN